jgi:hypothetical protein
MGDISASLSIFCAICVSVDFDFDASFCARVSADSASLIRRANDPTTESISFRMSSAASDGRSGRMAALMSFFICTSAGGLKNDRMLDPEVDGEESGSFF